jgi:hypothetical protein
LAGVRSANARFRSGGSAHNVTASRDAGGISSLQGFRRAVDVTHQNAAVSPLGRAPRSHAARRRRVGVAEAGQVTSGLGREERARPAQPTAGRVGRGPSVGFADGRRLSSWQRAGYSDAATRSMGRRGCACAEGPGIDHSLVGGTVRGRHPPRRHERLRQTLERLPCVSLRCHVPERARALPFDLAK